MDKKAIWKITKPFGSRPPEAKVQPKRVNINTMCRVKLTEYGVEVLYKHSPHVFSSAWWRGDTKEYTTELWNLMKIFGDTMWMGNTKQAFDGNNIEIMEKL